MKQGLSPKNVNGLLQVGIEKRLKFSRQIVFMARYVYGFSSWRLRAESQLAVHPRAVPTESPKNPTRCD